MAVLGAAALLLIATTMHGIADTAPNPQRIFIIGGSANGYLSSVEVFDVHNETFSESANLLHARMSLAAATLGGVIHAVGGLADGEDLAFHESFDPKRNDQWQNASAMPTPRSMLAVAASSSTLYAVGGNSAGSTNVLEAFNPKTQNWTRLHPMPTERHSLGAAIVGNFLYAIGGWPTQSVVEKYDIARNGWSAAANLLVERHDHCVAVLDGRVYAIGGYNKSSAEVYNLTSNAWNRIADMAEKRQGCGAVGVGGHVYVFGGDRSNFGGYLSSIEVYDPLTNTWRMLAARMKTVRAYFAIATL